MATSSARTRLLGHGFLAVMFTLGALWAALRAWGIIESGAVGWRLAIPALALLGFVSLALREARAISLARRNAGVDNL